MFFSKIQAVHLPGCIYFLYKDMGVSENRGTPKWMVYNGKPCKNGWFRGKTHYFRKHHGIQPTWAGWSSRSLYFQRRQRGVTLGDSEGGIGGPRGLKRNPNPMAMVFSTEIYCNRGWLKILPNFGSTEFFQCLKCMVLFEECFPLMVPCFALAIYRPLYHAEKLDINLPRFPTRPNKNQRVGGSSRLKFFSLNI